MGKHDKQGKGGRWLNNNVICLPSAKSTDWKTEIKFVTECSLSGNTSTKPTIYLPIDIHTKVVALTEEMKSMEWLGYLIGEIDDDVIMISDLFIPEQEVTGASVDVTGRTPDGVIGTIHSHHNMGAFFSGTDDEFIGSNHDVMIVIGSDEYKARIRKKVPCGAFRNMDAVIKIYSPNTDTKKFIEESKAKITKKVWSVRSPFLNIFGQATGYGGCSTSANDKNDGDDDIGLLYGYGNGCGW